MKEWYALRSKPRMEAPAVAMLSQAEIEAFLPMVRSQRSAGRSAEFIPFFPSYFFARLDASLGEIRLARYTRGVVQVVSFGDEPCPVPDDLISYIRDRVARTSADAKTMGFAHGDRVVIASGPLRGTEAIFDRRLSGSGRAQVLLQLLQRLCRAQVQVRHLRFLTQAAGTALI